MKRTILLLTCLALLVSLAACGGSSAAADTTAATESPTAASTTSAATAAPETLSGDEAAVAALCVILQNAAADTKTGAAGTPAQNALYAAQIYDWCGEYQNTVLEQQAVKQFAATLNDAALEKFRSDQLPAIYAMASTLSMTTTDAIDGFSYTPKYTWGAASDAFAPIYNALGLTLSESCGPACSGDAMDLTSLLPYQLDWDGDGKPETIALYTVSDSNSFSGTVYCLRLIKDGISYEYDDLMIAYTPTVMLADPDQDNVQELFVSGDIASEDFETFCWKLEEKEPVRVHFAPDFRYPGQDDDSYAEGQVAGIADGTTVLLNSKVYILGTYFGLRSYHFADGKLAPVPDSIWDLSANDAELLTNLPLTAEETDGQNGADTGKTLTLPAGTALTITGTDASSSVWFRTGDGIFGRFEMAKGSSGGVSWTVGGVSELDAFVHLPYAD